MINITGKLLIYSNITYNTTTTVPRSYVAGVQITLANVTANKITIIGIKSINYQSSSLETTFKLCLYKKINVSHLSKNVSASIDQMDVKAIAQLDFGKFVYASDSINMVDTSIQTVSLFVTSLGNMSKIRSVTNASARSCRTNTGIGRGTTIQYLNNYCTSGSSSCGYGTVSNTKHCIDIVQYFMFLSHSFPYISKGPYLSTGSGGYGYNLGKNGAGGGIIFLLAQ